MNFSALKFEKYTPKDFKSFHDLVKSDEVMKYVFGRGMTSDEASQKFDSILKINNEQGELGYFKVIDSVNDEVVGDCKIVLNTHLENSLEIGYLLKQFFWRMGIGSFICEYLIDFARKEHAEKAIIAIIDPDNKASRSLLTKFGFESYWKGIEHDTPTEKLILKKL